MIPPDSLLVLRAPLLILATTFVVLFLAGWLGATRFAAFHQRSKEMESDFTVIQGATLTLLGLIIGFTFSMALSRYDQRKNYEEEEANAIGTEYLRASLLPAADARKVKTLLRQYVDERIRFYETRDEEDLGRIAARTSELQNALWDAVREPATAQPTPLNALVLAGMNDVINTQGYTQAAWWNRIPFAAWVLMGAIGVCATLLVGIGAKSPKPDYGLLAILPAVVAIAFFLIADIDSPRRGVIRVVPWNLVVLKQSLPAP